MEQTPLLGAVGHYVGQLAELAAPALLAAPLDWVGHPHVGTPGVITGQKGRRAANARARDAPSPLYLLYPSEAKGDAHGEHHRQVPLLRRAEELP